MQPPSGRPRRDIQWAFGQMVPRAVDRDLGRIHGCVSHGPKAVMKPRGGRDHQEGAWSGSRVSETEP